MKNVEDAPESPALGSSLYALFIRDMRAGRRIGGGTSLGVVFFLILVTLSAFAVGPDLICSRHGRGPGAKDWEKAQRYHLDRAGNRSGILGIEFGLRRN